MNEKIQDRRIQYKFKIEKLISSFENKLLIPYIETAPSIGIEIKNDIFALSTLLNFKTLATVIAIPDLLTPGTNEITWNKPIKIADL